jgi:hypothetical protein
MKKKIIPNNNEFPRFLNQLAKDLSKFYYNKLSKKFKVQNNTIQLLRQIEHLRNSLDLK